MLDTKGGDTGGSNDKAVIGADFTCKVQLPGALERSSRLNRCFSTDRLVSSGATTGSWARLRLASHQPSVIVANHVGRARGGKLAMSAPRTEQGDGKKSAVRAQLGESSWAPSVSATSAAPHHDGSRRVHVLISADDGYAHACAVVLESMLEHVSVAVSSYVVDCGLTPARKRSLEAVVRHAAAEHGLEHSLRIVRLPPAEESTTRGGDRAAPSRTASHDTGPACAMLPTWARLLALDSRVLPADVTRVLYLDCDVLVRADIAPLWDTDLNGCAVGAVVDLGMPRGHEALLAVPPQSLRVAELTSVARAGAAGDGGRGILGPWRTDEHEYFNAGVLMMEMAAMRQDLGKWLGVARELCGPDGSDRSRLPHLDQDLLNLWLCGRWHALDISWNLQGAGTYAKFRCRDDGPFRPQLFDEAGLQALQDQCRVAHFTGAVAPRPSEVLFQHAPAPSKPWGYW